MRTEDESDSRGAEDTASAPKADLKRKPFAVTDSLSFVVRLNYGLRQNPRGASTLYAVTRNSSPAFHRLQTRYPRTTRGDDMS